MMEFRGQTLLFVVLFMFISNVEANNNSTSNQTTIVPDDHGSNPHNDASWTVAVSLTTFLCAAVLIKIF